MNTKQENFKRIADNRTSKIIDLISKLHNLTNASFYEYTDEQIDDMFKAIQKELDKQKKYLCQKELKKKEGGVMIISECVHANRVSPKYSYTDEYIDFVLEEILYNVKVGSDQDIMSLVPKYLDFDNIKSTVLKKKFIELYGEKDKGSII